MPVHLCNTEHQPARCCLAPVRRHAAYTYREHGQYDVRNQNVMYAVRSSDGEMVVKLKDVRRNRIPLCSGELLQHLRLSPFGGSRVRRSDLDRHECADFQTVSVNNPYSLTQHPPSADISREPDSRIGAESELVQDPVPSLRGRQSCLRVEHDSNGNGVKPSGTVPFLLLSGTHSVEVESLQVHCGS